MHTVFVTDNRGTLAGWIIRYLLEAGYAVKANMPSSTGIGTTAGANADIAIVRDTLQAEGVPIEKLTFTTCRPDKSDGWKSAMRGADAVMLTPLPRYSPAPSGSASTTTTSALAPSTGGKDAANARVKANADGKAKSSAGASEKMARGIETILKAAVAVGVPKAIMTSSQAANYPDKKCKDAPLDEDFWTDEHNRWLTADMKVALKAERKAWNVAKSHPRLRLVTILPGAVMGPGMGGRSCEMDQALVAVLNGVPYPSATLSVCDVRDLAKLHILALQQDAADGKRVVAQSEEMTMPELARILKDAYPDRRISTGVIPNFAISGMARFQPSMQALNALVGLRYHRDASRARTLLGWNPRPAKETILDTAAYLIETGNI